MQQGAGGSGKSGRWTASAGPQGAVSFLGRHLLWVLYISVYRATPCRKSEFLGIRSGVAPVWSKRSRIVAGGKAFAGCLCCTPKSMPKPQENVSPPASAIGYQRMSTVALSTAVQPSSSTRPQPTAMQVSLPQPHPTHHSLHLSLLGWGVRGVSARRARGAHHQGGCAGANRTTTKHWKPPHNFLAAVSSAFLGLCPKSRTRIASTHPYRKRRGINHQCTYGGLVLVPP